MLEPMTAFEEIPGLRLPRQRRSRERLERILDAAEALIARDGIPATSMAAVAAAAGTSVGALYARFEHKRALVHAVHVRFLIRQEALIALAADAERWRGQSLRGVLDGMVRVSVAAIRGNAGLIRAFMLAAATDDAMRARAEAASRHASAAVLPLLLERRAEIRRENPEAAADFALRFVAATTMHSLVFERPTPRTYGDDELAEFLAAAARAYLLATG